MNFLSLPDYLIILVLNVVSVSLILTNQRFELERKVRRRYGVDRHWWIPPLALILAFLISVVEIPSVLTAFSNKFEILALIFAFGVMSRGLGESGFFRHISYRIVKLCKGDTSRLILYIFLMTSAITFFTTNDIVVLLLTPIIVEICFEAGIKNTKLILLSQFVAANTLSMGLLTGSPTNLIIADALGIDFFSYLLLMIVPAVVSLTSSYLLLRYIIRIAEQEKYSVFSDLRFTEEYSVPEENPEPVFTRQMKDWIAIFSFFVVSVAVITYLKLSLFYSAVPGILIAFTYWHFSDTHGKTIMKPLKSLPYGIFFFGMTFFIFAEQFSRTGFVQKTLIPFLQQFFQGEPLRAAFIGIYSSGFLVNVFNDLPAAAMVSQILPELQLGNITGVVLTQASLVGLNIGTYLTPIGALAGLIWFNQLRLQKKNHEKLDRDFVADMKFPKRTDLVRFGLFHFAFTGFIAGSFLLVEWALYSFLV